MQIQQVKNGNTLLCGNYVSTTSERNCLSQLLMFHTALMTATDLRALAGLTYYFKRPSTHLYFIHARTHTPTTQYQHHLLPIDYMNTVCVCACIMKSSPLIWAYFAWFGAPSLRNQAVLTEVSQWTQLCNDLPHGEDTCCCQGQDSSQCGKRNRTSKHNYKTELQKQHKTQLWDLVPLHSIWHSQFCRHGTSFNLSDIHSSAGMVLALICLTFTVLQAWNWL